MATLVLAPTASPREIATTVNQALDGKLNAQGTLTLAAGAGSTVVTDTRVGPASSIPLTALTSNAAAALGTTYVSARANGSFTLTHSNTGTADRTFSYAVLGG